MKKLLLIIALAITGTTVYAQKSIDALFEKYAGRDGFVTVTISGDLLKLVNCFNDNDVENSLPGSITGIRVLAQEDKNIKVENFYERVIRDVDLKSYDEFMRVNESDQDLRMLVRTDGNKFKEFLLIAGGEDNAIIQIKGSMTHAEAKKLSRDAKRSNGLDLFANHE